MTAAWAKDDEVVVQWQLWQADGSFDEYRARVAKDAALDLVLGRGLGRHLSCKDPPGGSAELESTMSRPSSLTLASARWLSKPVGTP